MVVVVVASARAEGRDVSPDQLQEILDIAKHTASEQHIDVKQYVPRQAWLSAEGEWHIFFVRADLKPNDHFSVLIRDDNRKATVVVDK